MGQILRLDVRDKETYEVPKDNPFVGQAGVKEEIWALGIRNPWRFSMDRKDRTLRVGDVGQNAWEEVSIVEKGDNLGWKVFEGDVVYAGSVPSDVEFRKPIHVYPPNSEGGYSITGGYVYRGRKFPGLYGWYNYGDYVTGKIWALGQKEAGSVENKLIDQVSSISSFGEDESGELFIVSHRSGQIFQLKAEPLADFSNEMPATLSATKVFRNLAKLEANWFLMPYEVNLPLWSDGAEKRWWAYVPQGEVIEFEAGQAWKWPVGSVFVKHFEFDQFDRAPKRIETRIMVRTPSE